MDRYKLEKHGLTPERQVNWNLSPARLYEESLGRGVARLAHMGAMVTMTAPHTGRSPNDRFIVRDESTEATVDWGPVNRSCLLYTSDAADE